MGVKVIGCDIALNHSAFVMLDDGELADYWYYTSIVGSANRSKEHGTLLPQFKSDKQTRAMDRLAWIKEYMIDNVASANPDYVGIEDYAVSKAQGAHYLGEIGGIARLIFFERGIPMRLHDPISVKMFTAYNGRAQKEDMEKAVASRWGVHFSDYNLPLNPKRKSTNRNRTTSEDLADAFSIAKLIWTEILLRKGELELKDLHPKEIQVFNRVTKTYPTSLLDRGWIQRKAA